MSFGSTTISTSEQRIGALTIQSSAYGLPIPLFWGKARITGNMIWYGDFRAIAHTTKQSSGGKGGGGVTTQNTTYTYTTAFMLGLCEGEVSAIDTVWSGKEKTTFATLGAVLLPGSMSQSAWGHLTSKHPAEALTYPGIAIAAHSAFDLGGSASLPNLSFEANGPRQFGSGIVDARPDEILTDLASHPIAGAGFPAARFDLAAYRTYTQAAGLFLSPYITQQQPASQHIEELLQATNSAPVWSEGKLKIVPYADEEVTGNGVTFTPSVAPVYDLTDDDFLPDRGQPPITITRKPAADAYNHCQVEYRNRANDYNIEIAEDKDLGSISTFGLRTADPVRLHAIRERDIASTIVGLILRRQLYIRNEYRFSLGWRHCLLEPMDVVTITSASAPGLTLFPVRIREIEEDENGRLSVLAEEFPFGIATPALIPSQPGSGYSVDYNVAPGNAAAPVVFEAPLSLAGQPEIWLATSGGSTWGGCEVWVSLDNATYKQVGTIYGPARHGTLTASLPSAPDPDTTNAVAVDLSVSAGQLNGGTDDDRDMYQTLCYVDGELVSFRNATLTGVSQYSLSSLRRGAYGSPIGTHAAGGQFARLDQAIFRYAYDADMLGKAVYIKLRSFNSYGGAYQDLSAISAHTYAIVGAPVGTVSGFALAQPWVGPTLSVRWDAYPGASHYKVEVWAGAVLRRTVDNIAGTGYEYTIEDSTADGGPYRAVELRLFARTATGQSTTAAILTPSNPQFGAGDITGLSVVGSVGQINIQADVPAALDYAGTMIWAGDTPGFPLNGSTLIYDGPTPFFVYPVAGGTTTRIRVAHYDTFGRDSLSASTELSATSILAGGVPTVSVPPAGTYLGDDVVYYGAGGSPDFKLYRWNGSTYIRAADGGDLLAASVTADKITAANLAAISANLGTITAGNITLDNSGFVRGGSTGYLTGAGFWMGYHSGAYKFHVGDPSGQFIAWTGSTLSIGGDIIATGNIKAGGITTSLAIASGTTHLVDTEGDIKTLLTASITLDAVGNLITELVIHLSLSNDGSPGNSATIDVKIDGATIGSKTVTAPAVVDFTISKINSGLASGSHSLTVISTGVVGYLMTVSASINGYLLGVYR